MKKLGTIALFTILFISFITVWHFSYQSGLEEASIIVDDSSITNTMPGEKGVFKRAHHAIDYSNMPVDETHQRVLETYYDNRAYHGAPPTIPHELDGGERTFGGNTCLKCHENGGYVEKYNAYTPVTPHPELVNCRQCHVPEYTSKPFKPTQNADFETPEVGVNNALLTSPPVIPHQIQLRENCLACHAGPSAPKEIRVSHPERVNCRQCHVPKTPVSGNGMFNRKPIPNGQ